MVCYRAPAASINNDMSKRKIAAELEASPSEARKASHWPLWAKVVASALLAFHVAAVLSGPLAFACASRSGPSPAAEPFARFFQRYASAMYLNHGYAFFAPDPGPNHLVDYKVEFDDGRPPVSGRFPDLAKERPRLLYHRHFMLSEALNTRFAPPEFALEPSPPLLTATAGERERYAATKSEYDEAKRRWQHGRRQYEAMRESIADHLKQTYRGDSVKIVRIEHLNADPEDVLHERKPLSAAESYRELPETIPARGGR